MECTVALITKESRNGGRDMVHVVDEGDELVAVREERVRLAAVAQPRELAILIRN